MAIRLDKGKIQSWQKMDDGRLRVMATISRVGELEYQMPNGEIQVETLTADELFNADSLDTAATAPVTLNHPPHFVTADNWKQYVVGSTGSQVFAKTDEGLVDIVFVIGEKGAIDAVEKDGIREVSAGYTTKHKKDKSRIYQTERRYNHFALVPKGRAGKTVALHMDSLDEELGIQIDYTQPKVDAPMKKYNGHDVSDAVYDMLTDMAGQLDKYKGDAAISEATITTLRADAIEATTYKEKWAAAQAQADSFLTENESLKQSLEGKMDASEISAELSMRLDAWSKAIPFLPEGSNLDSSDDVLSIQLKAINAIKPDLPLEAKAQEYGDAFPVYVQATFDALETPSKNIPTPSNDNAWTESLKRAQAGGDRSGASIQDKKVDSQEQTRLDDMAKLEAMYKRGVA